MLERNLGNMENLKGSVHSDKSSDYQSLEKLKTQDGNFSKSLVN